ncbi:hypothetical protein H5410_047619 [Solanum commersonii]|uniref:Uncharacterized protein n=1 Tax=Solanum commersonii TaxID=4109 RepID=A0A9J5XFM9_SOLCO|nr:hypothetical protein H5410_047619 [Solanum commersonii]
MAFFKRLNTIIVMSPQLESLTLCDMIDLNGAFIVTFNLRLFKLINIFKFQNSYPMVGSKLMEVRYVHAAKSLLELRNSEIPMLLLPNYD